MRGLRHSLLAEMITHAISSARPHQGHPDYASNQTRARKSWKHIFGWVIYASPEEPDLALPGTLFQPQDDPYPTIKSIAQIAAKIQDGLVTVLNADIVLIPEFMEVMQIMVRKGICAATSRRRTFTEDIADAKLVREDRGLDIWVAEPGIWSEVARFVPASLKFGHFFWDTWMLGFLKETVGLGFRDFTAHHCVFHPQHDGRHMPYNEAITSSMKANHYVQRARLPSLTIDGDAADWSVT
jgi:hypothetical protein